MEQHQIDMNLSPQVIEIDYITGIKYARDTNIVTHASYIVKD
jgi:hypothetical protein